MLSACGRPGGKHEEATVYGKVTLDGKPVAGGRVIFAHVQGPGAAADIKPDGTYTTTAAVGKTEVSIDYRAPGEAAPKGRPGMVMLGKSLVPEKYENPKTSGLSLEIKSGKNEHNIDMKSQ